MKRRPDNVQLEEASSGRISLVIGESGNLHHICVATRVPQSEYLRTATVVGSNYWSVARRKWNTEPFMIKTFNMRGGPGSPVRVLVDRHCGQAEDGIEVLS